MRRSTIGLMLTLALAILVAPLGADAQQPKNVPRIGLLADSGQRPDAEALRRHCQVVDLAS